jgi:hypothetical protein
MDAIIYDVILHFRLKIKYVSDKVEINFAG